MQLTENEKKLISFIGEKYQSEQISDECLVQIIELAGGYLGLKSIAEYAKANKMSYNGVKNHRKIIEVLNNKYVKNNE